MQGKILKTEHRKAVSVRSQTVNRTHGLMRADWRNTHDWVRRMTALGGEDASIQHCQIKRDETTRGIVEAIANDKYKKLFEVLNFERSPDKLDERIKFD